MQARQAAPRRMTAQETAGRVQVPRVYGKARAGRAAGGPPSRTASVAHSAERLSGAAMAPRCMVRGSRGGDVSEGPLAVTWPVRPPERPGWRVFARRDDIVRWVRRLARGRPYGKVWRPVSADITDASRRVRAFRGVRTAWYNVSVRTHYVQPADNGYADCAGTRRGTAREHGGSRRHRVNASAAG